MVIRHQIFFTLTVIEIIIQSLNFRGIGTVKSLSDFNRNHTEFRPPIVVALAVKIGLAQFTHQRRQSDQTALIIQSTPMVPRSQLLFTRTGCAGMACKIMFSFVHIYTHTNDICVAFLSMCNSCATTSCARAPTRAALYRRLTLSSSIGFRP